jgi:hypothetical protein
MRIAIVSDIHGNRIAFEAVPTDTPWNHSHSKLNFKRSTSTLNRLHTVFQTLSNFVCAKLSGVCKLAEFFRLPADCFCEYPLVRLHPDLRFGSRLTRFSYRS